MDIILKLFYFKTVLLILMIILLPNKYETDNLTSKIDFKCSIRNSNAVVGEPLIVDLKIKNTSDKDIDIDLGFRRLQNIVFRLKRTEKDKVVFDKEKMLEFHGGSGPPKDVKIVSKEEYSQVLFINTWFKIPEPGEYRVSIGIKSSSINPGYEVAKDLKLIILPKDVKKLDKMCKKLSKDIPLSGGEDKIYLIEALSYIEDDVAISFILDVINGAKSGDGIYPLLEGLKRINTIKSAKALTSLLQHHDKTIQRWAEMELLLMQNLTEDQEILKYLKDVLKGEKLPPNTIIHEG